jgi:hypothetical protein
VTFNLGGIQSGDIQESDIQSGDIQSGDIQSGDIQSGDIMPLYQNYLRLRFIFLSGDEWRVYLWRCLCKIYGSKPFAKTTDPVTQPDYFLSQVLSVSHPS